MAEGTLTGTVTSPVLLGQGQYGDQLLVSAGGAVEVAGAGAVAVGAAAITGPSSLAAASIVNDGTLSGVDADGVGRGIADPGIGGDGVLLPGIGTVVNAGTISGGVAGPGLGVPYGVADPRGGAGIDLSGGGTLQNTGQISGGASDGPPSSNAGAGVLLGGAATVTNSGTIAGGGGLFPGYVGGTPGSDDAGILFQAGGTLTNTGQIVAGYDARAACVFRGAAHVTNAGTIDGLASAAGLDVMVGGVLANTGVIEGGLGSASNSGHVGLNGRAGLLVGGTARIYNGGDISGGTGVDSLAVSNTPGGGGPGSGGIGVVLEGPGSIFDNAGTLTAGEGGYASDVAGGAGGVGAVVGASNLLVNTGDITGGAGGSIIARFSGPGGAGGAGAVLLGGELCTLGTITGGAGGNSIAPEDGGAGGAGVFISSGKLVAAGGTISGGAAASGYGGPSTAPAVVFGNYLPGTLVADPGAVFAGGVVASSSAKDTLVLGGTASGTLSGFGDIGGIRNFSEISERDAGTWSLAGTFTNAENLSMGANAFLALDGTVAGSQVDFSQSAGDTLHVEAPARFSGTLSGLAFGDAIQLAGITAASFAYDNDQLNLLGSNGDTVSTLIFAGPYASGDFQLVTTNDGAQIVFIGNTT